MSNVLETLQALQDALTLRNDLQNQLHTANTQLDSLLSNLQESRKSGLISFPFVYRDLLIRVDSVNSIIVEKVSVLEDPKDTL